MIFADAAGSAVRNHARYVVTGASNSTLPPSMSCITAVAVRF